MMHWWAVYCRANKEALANLWLQRRGFVTYFPHECHKPFWANAPGSKSYRELISVRAQLPGYLFVETEAQYLNDVNSTIGVSTVVHTPSGTPVSIAAVIIDALKKRLGSTGKAFAHKPPKSSFESKVGYGVKGKEGWPHWGLIGEIMRVCGDQVGVRMLMLGSPDREVLVPAESLELMDLRHLGGGRLEDA